MDQITLVSSGHALVRAMDAASFSPRLAMWVHNTEMVPESHPAMKGLGKLIRAPGLRNIHFDGNRFDGYYLSEGIVLRSDLQ